MSHYWLLITFPWFGTASLQYVNTDGSEVETFTDPLDITLGYPLPYSNYFNMPRNDHETYQNDATNIVSYTQLHQEDQPENFEHLDKLDSQRKRRTIESDIKGNKRDSQWLPNLVDTDKTMYLQNENEVGAPYIQGFAEVRARNANDTNGESSMEKRNFSPWGGKRDKPYVDHAWTWKRAANIREPSLPKRVRFSPWGGKRNGQLIYKPGSKGTKIIFSSAYAPELTRIISKYSPSLVRLNLAGLQFVPTLNKHHRFKILALSTILGDRQIREALPFNSFAETVPKIYKPGHPYVDVNLKRDSKRKLMFSAWGGKRSPPIIGPIWTPSIQNIKDSTLNAILISRDNQDIIRRMIKT